MTMMPEGRAVPAVLRIALPAFRRAPKPIEVPLISAGEKHQDFKRLLDLALEPCEVIPFRLTKTERRQLAAQRKVRKALYEPLVTA